MIIINLVHNYFLVHLNYDDLLVTQAIEELTVHVPPQYVAPLTLIDYMPLMSARCTESDRGLKASITFCNIHCVGRWIQRNIFGIDHTTSFTEPVLQIIHSLMIRQHTICVNTFILQQLIANSQCRRGAKYSLLILVTRLVRNFLPDEEFSAYDWVFVVFKRIMSAYNSCLHSI